MLPPHGPFRRTHTDTPTRQDLAAPLRTASASVTPLRLGEDGSTTVAEWHAQWLGMFLTGVVTFGAITTGLAWAWHLQRIPGALLGVLLGILWLAFFPAIAWLAFRTYRHAWRNKEHLVLDRAARTLSIASLDGEVAEHPAAHVHGLVHVSRMQQIGHGGNLWKRIDEFSVLTGGPGEPLTQTPLFSLEDTGPREGELRALMNELPRALDCDRIRIAFDRHGQDQDADQDRKQ